MCDAGYVCTSGANSSRPTDGVTGYICPPGSYCPQGSRQETNCPKGTFSNKIGLGNVTECEDCTPGTYCLVDGLTAPSGNCSAGHYCTLGAIAPNPTGQSYGDVCLAGHYCPEGSAVSAPCPAGTFLPDAGRAAFNDCLPCTEGRYCEQDGMTNVTGMCTNLLLNLLGKILQIF